MSLVSREVVRGSAMRYGKNVFRCRRSSISSRSAIRVSTSASVPGAEDALASSRRMVRAPSARSIPGANT